MGDHAFRLFLLGYGVDRWADMLWTTTLAWLASAASSPALSGLILAAAFLPHVAGLIFGGVQADRRSAVAITKATTGFKALFLLVLLAAQVGLTDSLLLVAVVAALLALADGFHDPAIETWGMHLRPPDEQPQAAAAEAMVWRVGQSLGAAVGGVLVGVGAAYALLAGAVLLLLARTIFALVGRRRSFTRDDAPDERDSWSHVRTGLSFLARHPVLPTTLSVQVIGTLVSGALLILLLPAVLRMHGWEGGLYGVAAMCFGLGLMVGSGVVLREMSRAHSRIRRPVRTALLFAVLANAPLVAVAFVDQPSWMVVDVFLYGLLLGPVGPLLGGYRRRQTPRSMSGVVASAVKMLLLAPEPLGPLAVGLLASAVGLRSAVLWCAAASAAVPLVALVRSPSLEAKVRQVGTGE